MTEWLLEDGYCVATLDISEESHAPLKFVYSGRLLVFNCDVTDAARIKDAIAVIVDRWEHVDVLVNNACLAIFSPFEEKPLEETRLEFEVNYFGYLNAIAAVLATMQAKGKGIIHNVSSLVGITGFPGIFGYASTKGAIESLTRTLVLEFETHGICVNLMHPPVTNTKSASPLGVPVQAMDDPGRVGRHVAKQILSTKPVIASGFRTAPYLF